MALTFALAGFVAGIGCSVGCAVCLHAVWLRANVTDRRIARAERRLCELEEVADYDWQGGTDPDPTFASGEES